MSPRLPRLTGAELLRALERDGWRERRRRGSHVILAHPTKRGRPVVPLHAGQVVAVGTLRTILDAAGLDGEALRRLL
ncbi:MAG: type II toxin-antitoxin system HicA family toxin [Chloroflexi bacterium]|nr:type II toxin-antitoxin system HicA family toxin [Bacteroidota bacterium]MCL5109870.1 type II toxin-antitoxin system HicA family toxin [Chloroflexota bacterium]MDA8216652.1 type II toxin-antitoxin system HicA family toxin [Dehalococcoidales bacterium]